MKPRTSLFDYFETELRNKCLDNFEQETLSEHAILHFNFNKVRPYHSPINILLNSDLFSDYERILLIDFLENMLIRKIVSVDRTSQAIDIIENSGDSDTKIVYYPLSGSRINDLSIRDEDIKHDDDDIKAIDGNIEAVDKNNQSNPLIPRSQPPVQSSPDQATSLSRSVIQTTSQSRSSPTQAPSSIKKDVDPNSNDTLMVKRKKLVKK